MEDHRVGTFNGTTRRLKKSYDTVPLVKIVQFNSTTFIYLLQMQANNANKKLSEIIETHAKQFLFPLVSL